MWRSDTSTRWWRAVFITPFQRVLVLSAMLLAFIVPGMIWPSESLAELIAVGERDTPSHKAGVALSALATLDSDREPFNLNILASNDDGDDHVQSVLDRVANFALIDADQLGESELPADQLAVIRAIAVIQKADGGSTVLVTRDDENERRVQAVIEAVFNNLDKLAILLAATAAYDPTSVLSGLGLDLHPVADRFYEEAKQEGAAASEDIDTGVASVDAAAQPSTGSAVELEIGMKILARERDALAGELTTLRTQQQSLAERFSDVQRSRDAAVTEAERLERSVSENEAVVNALRADLEAVRGARDQARTLVDRLQQRVNSVSFASVEEASRHADDMRLRAEKAEARYEEAYQIGEACLQQRSGGSSQAQQALLQIERMEARLRQVTRDHRQCIAALEASAN